jgi:flagellar hook assembly protein FlgD
VKPRLLLCTALLLCLLVLPTRANAAPPTVTLHSSERSFSPDGDDHEDVFGFSYQVSERSRVSIEVIDTHGEIVRRLQTDVPTEGGASSTWDGRRDASTAIAPDGDYRYRVTAVDEAGERGSAERRVVIDTAPVAAITAPGADATVTGKVRLRVAPLAGRVLTGGRMYSCYSASRCNWQNLGSLGTAEASGARELDWDTQTMPTGDAWVWGYADYVDAFGASHSYPMELRHVIVQRPVTVSVNSRPQSFSPDGDSYEDAYGISYTITAPGTVSVRVRNVAGTVVRRLATEEFAPEGGRSVAWDGRDDGGATVPDGEYTYTVDVVGAIGPPASATGRLGVDTAPVAAFLAPEEDAIANGVVSLRVGPAAGRTLTGGSVYLCYSNARCNYYNLGSLGEADGFGARGLTWDTAFVATGEKWLWGYAHYEDAFGASHSYPLPPRRVVVTRAVQISNVSADRYFSPDGDGQEDTIGVSYALTAPAKVTVRVRDQAGGLIRRLESDVARTEGGQSFSWDGRDEDGARVPDGIYRYTVDAVGAIGEPVSASGRIGVDTQPVAAFDAPAEDAVVTGSIRVKVTPAAARTLTGGSVYLCYSNARCNYYNLGSLGVADFDGTRGLDWNTNPIPTGEKWLWGYAHYEDAFGASHSYPLPPRRVVVTRAVQISNVSADRYFSPDGDGQEDTGGPYYCIDAPADMRLTISRDAGAVRTLRADERGQGCQSFSWDGRDETGAAMPSGGYTYALTATGEGGLATTVTGRIGVRRDPPGRVLRPAPADVISRSGAFTFAPNDVPVSEVVPCITTNVCFPITAANAAGQWATSMALTPELNGDRTLRVTARWRDPYGSSHETALPAIPVTVNTVAPEVELEATPAGGEAPVSSRIRLDARTASGRTLNYRLDLGDGSPVATGTVSNPYAPVEIAHAYARPGPGTARAAARS